MLVLIYGGKLSGKSTIINYLVKHKNFEELLYSADIFEKLVQMKRWTSDFVCKLPSIEYWDLLRKRPCAKLFTVIAPSSSDWRKENDDDFYSQIIKSEGGVKILNFGTLEMLHAIIDSSIRKIRPSWDKYFMDIAEMVSMRSNCMKGRVGCVIVKNNRIISTGYNGTPSGMKNCFENGCDRCNIGSRCNIGLEYCLCVHAEENALLFLGMQFSKGTVLYVTRFPCTICTRKIVQMGVKRVVYVAKYGSSDEEIKQIYRKLGIETKLLKD